MGVKGADSGGKDRQIRRPFHPEADSLRVSSAWPPQNLGAGHPIQQPTIFTDTSALDGDLEGMGLDAEP